MAGFFFKKDSFENTLAIDMGTASISGAISRRNHNGGKPEVLKVFRYPIDVLKKDSTRTYTSRLAKMFDEAHKVSHTINRIAIGFSSPLFLEKTVQKRFVRAHPGSVITASEVAVCFREAEELLRDASTAVVVERMVRRIAVNGYPVARAEGYKGNFLDIELECMLINSFFAEFIADTKEKFFPRSLLAYYSDSAAIAFGAGHMFSKPYPLVAIDAGGEVTAVFTATDRGRTYAQPVPFGVRTLNRRVSAFLKLDSADAEALVRKLSAGTLDPAIQRRLEKVAASAMEDWWNLLRKSLKELDIATSPTVVAMTGGGADVALFPRTLASGWRQVYEYEITPSILRAEELKEHFASLGVLAGGGDFMLASLLLL